MNNMNLDCMGKACPQPVIETKRTMKNAAEGTQLTVKVDNAVAVQNLNRLADDQGWIFQSKTIKENAAYEVYLTKGEAQAAPGTVELSAPSKKDAYVVQVAADHMGEGDPELSQKLIQSFFYALQEQDNLPEIVLFYNGGVRLAVKDSPIAEELKSLKAQGAEIYACGLCLNYYELTEQVDTEIVEITNMYRMIEIMREADHLIRP